MLSVSSPPNPAAERTPVPKRLLVREFDEDAFENGGGDDLLAEPVLRLELKFEPPNDRCDEPDWELDEAPNALLD